MEAMGSKIPSSMTAKSLLPVLESVAEGQVDAARTFVVTGRERHVSYSNDNLPYPSRAIRTKDFLYVHNFAPDRWPAGKPMGLDDPNAEAPDWESLQEETYTAYSDMDASPTKAWMIHNRAKNEVKQAFDLGFGKRPQEELYDLDKDPNYMSNVADDPDYADTKKDLLDQLMAVLEEQNDPRVVEDPVRFENPPYTSPLSGEETKRRESLNKIEER
jgi:arylsulfatase A-like enzyme